MTEKQKWEIALEKFVNTWKNKKDVSGIIVAGSYITGNPTKHSDLDVPIVLKRGCKWRQRGNEIIDGILIEYFANPVEKIQEYMENDNKKRRKIDAHMFSTGKIVLDKEGEVKRLKTLAKKYLNKKFEKTPKFKNELNKYGLFDDADNLEEVYDRGNPDFEFVYYNYLNKLFDRYSEFLEYDKFSENKIFRFLTDNKDREKYLIKEYPDKVFAQMFLEAIKERDKSKMLQIFNKLAKYIQNKMGGFKLDGWKLKSAVD